MIEPGRVSNGLRKKLRPSRLFRRLDAFAVKRSVPRSSVEDSTAIYLTFDDGPHAEYTAALGDLLSRRNHQATFFFAGSKVQHAQSVVDELAQQGHAIGSHSANHLRQWANSGPRILFDYWSGHRSIERSIGRRTTLFRPPYGHHDWRSALFVKLKKLDLVLWNVESFDWKPDATTQSVVDNVTEGLVPGSIVLLHDAIIDTPESADRSHTLAAVGEILDHLEARGLRSKALG